MSAIRMSVLFMVGMCGTLALGTPAHSQVMQFVIDNKPGTCPFTGVVSGQRFIPLYGTTVLIRKEDLVPLIKIGALRLSTCSLLFSDPTPESRAEAVIAKGAVPQYSISLPPMNIRVIAKGVQFEELFRVALPPQSIVTVNGVTEVERMTWMQTVQQPSTPGSPSPPPKPSPTSQSAADQCRLTQVCMSPQDSSLCGTLRCGDVGMSICSSGKMDLKVKTGDMEVSYKL